MITAGSEVLSHQAQAQAAEANEEAARRARQDAVESLSIRQVEEGVRASKARREVDRQATTAEGLLNASAAQAGVSGGSLDLLLGDLEGSRGRALQDINDQYTVTVEQLERAKDSEFAIEAGRQAAVPEPSVFATGLRIGGRVTNYLTQRAEMNRLDSIYDDGS